MDKMSLFEWLSTVGVFIGGAFTAAIWISWITWWLSRQFTSVRNMIWEQTRSMQKNIEDKLEYHERHDDQRFTELKNDMWILRVRAAAKDGVINGNTLKTAE